MGQDFSSRGGTAANFYHFLSIFRAFGELFWKAGASGVTDCRVISDGTF